MHAHRSEDTPPGAGDAAGRGRHQCAPAAGTSTCRASTALEVAAPANGSVPLVLLVPGPVPRAGGQRAVRFGRPEAVSRGQLRSGQGRGPAAARTHLRAGERAPDTITASPATVSGRSTGTHRRPSWARSPVPARRRLPAAGAAVADLYAGAGLFTAPLADAVGVTGSVLSVEGSPGTSRDARKNLHDAVPGRDRPGQGGRVLREKARDVRRRPAGPCPGRRRARPS